jgi:transposase InsO family protein
MVSKQRKKNSEYGGKKLHYLLKDEMELKEIKMGRDNFFKFLRANNLLIKKRRNYHTTTNSNHRFFKFPNIVKNALPTRPEQLWVSDITYIKTENGHNYLALVTDAYSKKIVGYAINSHMKASLCVDALKMAIKNRKYPELKLIHHSDRGFQYCSNEYTSFAEGNKIELSMTEQYDPYENAVAERVNRTLKYEYALIETIKSKSIAKKMVDYAVEQYNNYRPHFSLDLYTPDYVHRNKNIQYKSYKKDKTNLTFLII